MGSPSANKRKSREQAFIILFEKSFNTELSVDEIMDIAIETEVISKDKMTADIVKKAEENIDEIVPVGVSINEAVEICKVYGSDEDKGFVNGILGSISREKED